MLGQVRFPTIVRIANLSELAGFHEEVRGEYPDFAQEQQINVEVSPEGIKPSEETRNFRFSTTDGAWSIVLNPSFVTLEASVATKYSNFDDFRERFAEIWDAALRHLSPTKATQQGLRYVDHFDWVDVTANAWSQYINKSLLGVLGVDGLAERTQHTLTDSRFELDDGVVLAFKYGLARAGPEQALGFFMDTDCFTQVHTDEVSVEATIERFNRFHDEIHVLFHWATTKKAKERFRGANAPA